MIGAIHAMHIRRRLLGALAVLTASAILSPVMADPLILQGATTFNRRILEPHEAEIEKNSGQQLTVIPNRTMLGIVALLEGRAHMAMTSASLESEVSKLKKAMPGLDYDRLKEFEIASTRVAFVVHPANRFARPRSSRSKRFSSVKLRTGVRWAARTRRSVWLSSAAAAAS